MESIYTFFKLFLPKYLRSLPIPKTLGGFKDLSGEDYLNLTPFFFLVLLILYSVFKTLLFGRRKVKKPKTQQPHVQEKFKFVDSEPGQVPQAHATYSLQTVEKSQVWLVGIQVETKLYESVEYMHRTTDYLEINEDIQKEESKVVTQMDIEDIGDNIAFCRCWRSKKFPLCDGSHNKHNAETRDNVGPLLLRREGDTK